MGFFDKLDDNTKTTAGLSRDSIGTYWQKITKIEEAVSRKKLDMLRVVKTTLKVIEGTLTPGTETTQVIMLGGNEYVEADVRRFYCGVSGETMEAANETPFKTIGERLTQMVGVTVEVEVKGRAYEDKEGRPQTFISAYVRRPILPDQLAEEGIDPNKFG